MKSYTERKEAWARKVIARGEELRTLRSTERLPPGQHLAKGKIPVLDLGVHPKIKLQEWKLEICGLVEAPCVLDWTALGNLEQVETVTDFHCVTTWSAFDCQWGGVRMQELLDLVQPQSDAHFVFYTSYDGYTTTTPVEALFAPDTLLCTRLNTKPLPLEYGGPARVIIPQLYAWKSPKFIQRIEFREREELGYWEQRGYNTGADPWLEARFG